MFWKLLQSKLSILVMASTFLRILHEFMIFSNITLNYISYNGRGLIKL